tara:strand:- start:1902 stop:3053 length:1152 start_codon:yes stop_codon:yes gene_type:complete
MSETKNNSEPKNNEVPNYDSTRVGDYTILTPKDKKASVFQKVTPREQYGVARDVANRAINEINAIRGNRPSSFTYGINPSNLAARRQAAETYGETLPGGRRYSGAREAAYDAADSYRKVLEEATARRNLLSTAPQISEIKGDFGYGPSIRYPESRTDTAPSGNHDAWINQQYRELLGRDAGFEGLNYWTGDLNRGATKDEVRSNIMLSDEYKNRLKLVTDYKAKHGTNPAEDWLDARVGPGGKWLMEGYGNKSATTSTGSTKTPEAPPNPGLTDDPNWDKKRGFAPGSFGIGPEYDKYTKLFQRSIDEGTTLEQAMYLSRTATGNDFLKAFGDKSMKRKWGGGRKGGSGGRSSSSSSSSGSGPSSNSSRGTSGQGRQGRGSKR